MDLAPGTRQNIGMSPAPASAIAVTVMLAVLTAALTMLRVPVPAGIGGSDKLHHLLAFAALALPVATVRPRWSLALALILAAYGGLIELVQPYVGRSRELADWTADLKGIAAGTVTGIGLNRLAWLVRWRRLA